MFLYDDKFNEYGITHVLIKKGSKLNMLIKRNDNYKELYSDNNFVLYERNAMSTKEARTFLYKHILIKS